MYICVCGLGYLGLVQSICLTKLGFNVIAYDINTQLILSLRNGIFNIYEPGLIDIFNENKTRINFITNFDEVENIKDQIESFIICVGTPLGLDNKLNTQYVYDIIHSIMDFCGDNKSIIIGRSTMLVGEVDKLHLYMKKLNHNNNIELLWSPEFLREGSAVNDTLYPERVIIGTAPATNDEVINYTKDIIATNTNNIVITDYKSAELIKIAANSYLAYRLSFINGVNELCSNIGANILDVQYGLSLDKRIGKQYFNPGIGFGGGCLPKDIMSFSNLLLDNNCDEFSTICKKVLEFNNKIVDRVVRLIDSCQDINNITIFGISFKSGTDDIRESQSLKIASKLLKLNYNISIYDPKANNIASRYYKKFMYFDDYKLSLKNSDMLLILTDWEEFKEINPLLINNMNKKYVFDAHYILDCDIWEKAGWIVYRL